MSVRLREILLLHTCFRERVQLLDEACFFSLLVEVTDAPLKSPRPTSTSLKVNIENSTKLKLDPHGNTFYITLCRLKAALTIPPDFPKAWHPTGILLTVLHNIP